MGLFDFGKSKKTASPTDFYSACVSDFHKHAHELGVAKKGNIFVPELMAAGQKMILTFLDDDFNRSEFGHDPKLFYYVVALSAWHAGLTLASRWHSDFSQLESYMEIIGILGPGDDASKLLNKHFPANVSQNYGESFFQHIYARWLAMIKPYEDLSDNRQYIFYALLAAYQLGVSMMLEKLGY